MPIRGNFRLLFTETFGEISYPGVDMRRQWLAFYALFSHLSLDFPVFGRYDS